MWTHLFVHNIQCCYVRSCGEHTTVRRGFNHVSFSFVKLSPNLYCSKGLIARGMALQLWMRWWKRLGCSPFLFCAAWHSQSPDCHQCQKVAHTQQGILSGAHWWDETGWLLPWSEVEWKTNVMEGDRERLCLISQANVSDGSYLAPCSTAVYYPKVAGWCWEEKGTGSPFVIHHSGGLLPLLSDRYMDNCSSCLQTQAHLNEQQAPETIPLLSLSAQVSYREDGVCHIVFFVRPGTLKRAQKGQNVHKLLMCTGVLKT